MPVFPKNQNTFLGNTLRDHFERIGDNNPLLWQLRIRENLETYLVDGKEAGCGVCPDKYICGGCRTRAYSYFNGNVKTPDIGYIHNKALWKK